MIIKMSKLKNNCICNLRLLKQSKNKPPAPYHVPGNHVIEAIDYYLQKRFEINKNDLASGKIHILLLTEQLRIVVLMEKKSL
jgi:hypothetical protein